MTGGGAGPPTADAAAAAGDAGPGLRGRAVRGALWTGAGRGVERLLGLATFVTLGRLLDPSAFGIVALASAVIAVVQVVSELGFATWLVQADEVDERAASTAFWTALGLGAVAAAALLAGAAPLAGALGEPDLAPVLRWLSLSLVLSGMASTPIALLSRQLRFKELAVRQTVSVALGAAAGIALAIAGAGVDALVAQLLVQQVASVLILAVTARWRPRPLWSAATAADIARFGLRLVGIQGLQQLRDRGEPFLIGALLGVTALGFWVIASRLLTVLLDLGLSVVSTVASPTFVRVRDEPERLFRAYETCLAASSLAVGPALIGLAVTSPLLVPLVFGAQWQDSVPVAALLALGGLATAMTFFDRSVFVARRRLGVELALVAPIVVLHLGLIVVVGPLGLVPLAVAVALRQLVTWPVRLLVLRRTVGMPLRAQRRALLVLGGSAVAGALALAVREAAGLDAGWGALAALGAVYAGLVAAVLGTVARPLVREVARDLAAVRQDRPD